MTEPAGPTPMLLWCPGATRNARGELVVCGARHIDEGEFATKPHHTHSCQSCGHTWRPAVVHTVGVQFLPGFKNEPPAAPEPLADPGAAVGEELSAGLVPDKAEPEPFEWRNWRGS